MAMARHGAALSPRTVRPARPRFFVQPAGSVIRNPGAPAAHGERTELEAEAEAEAEALPAGGRHRQLAWPWPVVG